MHFFGIFFQIRLFENLKFNSRSVKSTPARLFVWYTFCNFSQRKLLHSCTYVQAASSCSQSAIPVYPQYQVYPVVGIEKKEDCYLVHFKQIKYNHTQYTRLEKECLKHTYKKIGSAVGSLILIQVASFRGRFSFLNQRGRYSYSIRTVRLPRHWDFTFRYVRLKRPGVCTHGITTYVNVNVRS